MPYNSLARLWLLPKSPKHARMPTTVCFRREGWSRTRRHPVTRETSRQDAFTYSEMSRRQLSFRALARPSDFDQVHRDFTANLCSLQWLKGNTRVSRVGDRELLVQRLFRQDASTTRKSVERLNSHPLSATLRLEPNKYSQDRSKSSGTFARIPPSSTACRAFPFPFHVHL